MAKLTECCISCYETYFLLHYNTDICWTSNTKKVSFKVHLQEFIKDYLTRHSIWQLDISVLSIYFSHCNRCSRPKFQFIPEHYV